MFFGMTRALFDSYIFGDTRFYYLSLIRESEYSDKGWGIHGLWPQYTENSYPSFCRDVTFDINELRTILPDLQKYWYSTESPNQDFWEHEWKKHGSCMFQEMNELQYFSKTLELFHYVYNKGIINNYKERNKALIPFSLDFKLI